MGWVLLGLLACGAVAGPASVYDAAELEGSSCDWARYPPTACRLRALLGEAFADYETRGGCYPQEHEGGGGFLAHGRACPQPGCASATTWIHPDGRMLVAMRAGERVDLYANDPGLMAEVPPAIQGYLDAAGEDGGPVTVAWAPLPAREDPASCRSDAEASRAERWRAARAGTGCDAEFSDFEQPLAVTAERAHFVETPDGAPRRAFVVAGDLVLADHRGDGPFVCAQYRAIAGPRTTGWMRRADTVPLDLAWEARERTPLPSMAAPPTWLTGAPEAFGDLRIHRTDSGVYVTLERFVAGHVCAFEGALTPGAPRRYTGGDPEGCSATAALFHNGVILWASSDCGGARASCSGAFVK